MREEAREALEPLEEDTIPLLDTPMREEAREDLSMSSRGETLEEEETPEEDLTTEVEEQESPQEEHLLESQGLRENPLSLVEQPKLKGRSTHLNDLLA